MSMRFALSIFALGILASGLALRTAAATTASASFGVTATVQASCRTTTNAIAFRTFAAAVVNTTSPVSVTCSNSVPYNVSLSAGMGLGTAVDLRGTAGFSAALLAYEVGSHHRGIFYRDQTPDIATLTGNGARFAQVIPGHDRISPGQYVSTGAFFDTMIVTVTY